METAKDCFWCMLCAALISEKLLSLSYLAGGTMTYGNVPMIIPCLATGYLLTVYLLLLLAQKHVKAPESSDSSKEKGLSQLSATGDQ